MVQKNREYHLRDARNTVWAMAAIGSLPLVVVVYLAVVGEMIQWDAITIGLVIYASLLVATTIYAGILCSQGKAAGRVIGNVIAVFFALKIPIGTALAVFVWVKLNSGDVVAAFEQPQSS